MARLVEESTTAVDVELLKRRFVRQNRELVKNNSAQSLRIRSLELDVARLLSENLSLREKVLHLQNEAYNARVTATSDAIDTLKAGLQQKLADLSDLVNGLNDLKDIPKDSSNDATAGMRAPEQQWKERVPLMAAMREHQMPTILENKSQLRRISDGISLTRPRPFDLSGRGSFVLSSPPITHVSDDFGDASSTSPKAVVTIPNSPKDEVSPAKPAINLETRRRRKDVTSKLEPRRHSILAQSPRPDMPESGTMLRTGAKRKLADCTSEREFQPRSIQPFTFNTAAPSVQPFESSQVPEKELEDLGLAKTKLKPPRKVLGEKTTNMSPQKNVSKTGLTESEEVQKKPVSNLPGTGRRSQRPSSIPIPSPPRQSPEMVEIFLPSEQVLKCDLRPKTPAPPDIFSPDSSLSSAKHTKQVDTPPPGSLSTINTLNTFNDGARPSRRARSAVNYAEPSLVAKMRRPGKELADAVTGLQDPRRAMQAASRKELDVESIGSKGAEQDKAMWKKGIEEVSAAGTEQGCSRETEQHQAAGSAKALSDLLQEARVKASDPRKTSSTKNLDNAGERAEELDLYEFKDASPTKPRGDSMKSKPGRAQRRYTTVHRDLDDGKDANNEGGRDVAAASESRLERAASRRKSMMI